MCRTRTRPREALLALMLHRQGAVEERQDDHRTEPLYYYDGAPLGPLVGFSEYKSLATTGRLYEHLMAKTGLCRGAVKRGLLRDVFGKRGSYPSEVEQAFRQSFPGVWSFVRRFNREDHGALFKELQRVESDLVIGDVAGSVVGSEVRTVCEPARQRVLPTERPGRGAGGVRTAVRFDGV